MQTQKEKENEFNRLGCNEDQLFFVNDIEHIS